MFRTSAVAMIIGLGLGVGFGSRSIQIPEHPPEAGRLLYLLENTGITSADGGTTVQAWTDPSNGKSYAAPASVNRPALIAPGFPRGDGGTDRIIGPATSQVLGSNTATEYLHVAVVNPASVAQTGAGANGAMILGNVQPTWFWSEALQTGVGSGLYEYVGGHWNAASSEQQRRQIRVSLQLGQLQIVWTRFKDGVITAAVNSLYQSDNISATALEDSTGVATGIFGSNVTGTRQFNGDIRAEVTYGAHSDSDKNLAIQSLAQRFGIALAPAPPLEQMVLFVVLGQSNGEGQGATIDPRTTDPTIEFYGYDSLWHHSAVEPLQGFKQHLRYRDYTPSAGVGEQPTKTGFLLAFADRLRALGETRRIGVMNCARGSTSSPNWAASVIDLTATTALSPIAQLRLDAALARGSIKIGAIIINQGEADAVDSALANGGWATNWTAVADRFVARYSAYFDKLTRIVLHRLFPTPFTGSSFHAQLRTTQANWADARSDTIRLDMPDPPVAGDAHLDTAGLVTLGESTADAWWAE